MAHANVAAGKFIGFVLVLICLTPLVGCIGLVANLLNAAGGGLVPAAFTGLRDQKVAVVCVSNSEFGPTSTSTELSRRMNRLLKSHVKDIQLVSHQEVADWIDSHNWDMVDFRAIGEGVGAELVVAVDVDTLSLHESSTMYKGRADVHVVVYDMKSGREVFANSPSQIVFPKTAGIWPTDISETQFRKQFLDVVADRIARNFYPFDINDDYARDAELLSKF